MCALLPMLITALSLGLLGDGEGDAKVEAQRLLDRGSARYARSRVPELASANP